MCKHTTRRKSADFPGFYVVWKEARHQTSAVHPIQLHGDNPWIDWIESSEVAATAPVPAAPITKKWNYLLEAGRIEASLRLDRFTIE